MIVQNLFRYLIIGNKKSLTAASPRTTAMESLKPNELRVVVGGPAIKNNQSGAGGIT